MQPRKLKFILLIFFTLFWLIPDLFADKERTVSDSVNISGLAFGMGISEVQFTFYTIPQFEIIYFSKLKFWVLSPMAGMMVNTVSGYYMFIGVSLPINIARGILLRPTFSPGYYFFGEGTNLGNPVEFRSGIELSFDIRKKIRLGFDFNHVSNAGLGKLNPGMETMALFLVVPIP
ncbi:MAG: acyloxyacyl hydrolase [Bacteroidetes bacterium]|nr:acyloxyacyl hydrolase [Bacteroidota bacterium]